MVLAIYNTLLTLALVGGAPWWLLRMATSGRYRAGLPGRLGWLPAAVRHASTTGSGCLVWLHAVSVGEVLAAAGVVAGLREAGYRIAVSTTTQAGQELAEKRFPECAVFYMPLDLPFILRRYLRALKPVLVVTMESELWPNLIHCCKLAAIPLAVANARVSDRSFPRYLKLKRLWAPLLREVGLFLAQSDTTAERLRQMGVAAGSILVTGNLKYDVRAQELTPMTRRIEGLLWQTRLIVAGSTVHGEEDALLWAWPAIHRAAPDAVLLIAPRHTGRFAEVLELIRKQGYPWFRCSHLLAATEPIFGGMVLLLDSIGDLASMYSLATVAFVGGSLAARGGHNPLEPAQFAVPVAMGESYENFREIVDAMRSNDAIRIVQRDGLAGALVELLERGQAMGERGQRVFAAEAGATGRTLSALRKLMGDTA